MKIDRRATLLSRSGSRSRSRPNSIRRFSPCSVHVQSLFPGVYVTPPYVRESTHGFECSRVYVNLCGCARPITATFRHVPCIRESRTSGDAGAEMLTRERERERESLYRRQCAIRDSLSPNFLLDAWLRTPEASKTLSFYRSASARETKTRAWGSFHESMRSTRGGFRDAKSGSSLYTNYSRSLGDASCSVGYTGAPSSQLYIYYTYWIIVKKVFPADLARIRDQPRENNSTKS